MRGSFFNNPPISAWYFSSIYLKPFCTYIDLSIGQNSQPVKKEILCIKENLLKNSHTSSVPYDEIKKCEKSLCELHQNFYQGLSQNIVQNYDFGLWEEALKLSPNLKTFFKTLSEFHLLFNPLHTFQLGKNEVSLKKNAWSPFRFDYMKMEWDLLFILIAKYYPEVNAKIDIENKAKGSFLLKRIDFSPYQNKNYDYRKYQEVLNTFQNYQSAVLGIPFNFFPSDLANKVVGTLQRGALASKKPLDSVAKGLFLSKRTLQRKLDQEDLQFLELKKLVRKVNSHQLLTTTEIPINEISESIGFSEPSVFTKFFKEWMGCTPIAYRKKSFPRVPDLSPVHRDIHSDNIQ